MQFFLLILFNIFMGAVLYLIISLKLERSATEFRERRLRREMDQIIQEFNATAERNISILENRISVLKKIMVRSGDIKSLDIVIDESGIDARAGRVPISAPPDRGDPDQTATAAGGKTGVYDDFGNNGAGAIKKGLLLIFEKFINILPVPRRRDAEPYPRRNTPEDELPGYSGGVSEAGSPVPVERPALIEKDFSHVLPETAIPEKTELPLTEDEISEIISSAEDKYSMVAVLFARGCGIDEISRYSGIPAGEVRLVLNLNSSR